MIMLEETAETFYVQGKEFRSPWIAGLKNTYLARHMIAPIRRVMGFWEQPGLGVKWKAELCGVYPGEFLAINRILVGSEISAVQFCQRYGLPGSASVELCLAMNCTRCGAYICSLPCIRCWDGPEDDPDARLFSEDFDESLLTADDPTDAIPGTIAKVEALARRYASGRHLWNKDDARIHRR